MSLGKELLQRRSELIETERKLNEQHDKKVISQWELIKYTIDNTKITKDTKYVSLGCFPDMLKENIKKLHNEDFTIFQDRNKCIRLYLSEEDYKNDIGNLNISNDKYKPTWTREGLYGKATKVDKDTIDSDKKSDFKINNNKQVEEDNKLKTVKAKCKENDFADLMNSLTRVVNWM